MSMTWITKNLHRKTLLAWNGNKYACGVKKGRSIECIIGSSLSVQLVGSPADGTPAVTGLYRANGNMAGWNKPELIFKEQPGFYYTSQLWFICCVYMLCCGNMLTSILPAFYRKHIFGNVFYVHIAGLCRSLTGQMSHVPCTWRSCRVLFPEWWQTISDTFNVWTSYLRAQSPSPREPSNCSSATPACCVRWGRGARWDWLLTLHRWGRCFLWSHCFSSGWFNSVSNKQNRWQMT